MQTALFLLGQLMQAARVFHSAVLVILLTAELNLMLWHLAQMFLWQELHLLLTTIQAELRSAVRLQLDVLL